MQTKNYLLSHFPSFVKNGTGARIYSKFLRRTVNSHRCRIFQDQTASDLKNTKEKKASHRRQNIKNFNYGSVKFEGQAVTWDFSRMKNSEIYPKCRSEQKQLEKNISDLSLIIRILPFYSVL